jgi:hypothetical protein
MGVFYLKKYRIYPMKIFFVLVLTFSTVVAFDFKHIEVEYRASYGVLGEVGEATAVLEIEEDRYKIYVEAQSTGWAKWVTSGRKERYESRGLIKDGLLLPSLFIKDRIWGEKTERKRYAFHHDTEKIHTLLTKVDGIKTEETRNLLSFYAKNDILSLFFNLPQLIGKEMQTAKKEFVAVGASRATGMVTIETPQGKKKKRDKESFR